MKKVQLLPPEVQNQIAAGEVVERPASVIKELVENSLDAGASRILIEIEKGGKKRIKVSDNGHGMTRQDAALAVQQHATSKVTNIDDLFHINSFGFRGEALAAIGSVSHLTMTTKTENDPIGTQITVNGGHINPPTDASANTGTILDISDLFYTTPVRLQYLKTDESEYRAIYKIINEMAIAHPKVSFTLQKEGKKTLSLAAVATISERIKQVFQRFSGDLLELKGPIGGMISAPESAGGSRARQYIIVNNRPISDPKMVAVVRRAYIDTVGLEKHLHPAFVLLLTIEPLLVDVNVHPRKTEVKFAEPRDVYNAVYASVSEALSTKAKMAFVPMSSFPTNSNTPQTLQQQSYTPPPRPSQKSLSSSLSFQLGSFSDRNTERSFAPSTTNNTDKNTTVPTLNFICQIDNKLLVAEGLDALYIFDQHALHERQRFEILLQQYESKAIATQALLTPAEIQLSPAHQSTANEYKKAITDLGFTFNKTHNGVSIMSVPVLLMHDAIPELFEDLLDSFEQVQAQNQIEKRIRRIIETRACRGSVMFGDPITNTEGQALLNAFSQTRFPDLCPHGRPNFYKIPKQDLMKHFHRI